MTASVGIAGLGAIGRCSPGRWTKGRGLRLVAVSARDTARAGRSWPASVSRPGVCPWPRSPRPTSWSRPRPPRCSTRWPARHRCRPHPGHMLRRRPAAPHGDDRHGKAHRRPHHRAHRRPARPRCRAGRAEGRSPRHHRDAQAPGRPGRGPLSGQHAIDLSGLAAPMLVFEGNALDAAAGFPANVNVAAALALAGIGPQRTTVRIWADPSASPATSTPSASRPTPPA